jgi:hypothetical protein
MLFSWWELKALPSSNSIFSHSQLSILHKQVNGQAKIAHSEVIIIPCTLLLVAWTCLFCWELLLCFKICAFICVCWLWVLVWFRTNVYRRSQVNSPMLHSLHSSAMHPTASYKKGFSYCKPSNFGASLWIFSDWIRFSSEPCDCNPFPPTFHKIVFEQCGQQGYICEYRS